MKTIIAGTRGITNVLDFGLIISEASMKNINITEVVSGCARGVDKMGEVWADSHHIPIKRFPADWEKYGKPAGIIRNREMVDYADALIAIWDGKSPGTQHVIDYARRKGLLVHVAIVEQNNKSSGTYKLR